MTVTTVVWDRVSVLVVVLKMEEATEFETTGGTPCVTGGIWMIASDVSEETWDTPSFTGGIEVPGSVSVAVRVMEVVVWVSLGLGDCQRR